MLSAPLYRFLFIVGFCIPLFVFAQIPSAFIEDDVQKEQPKIGSPTLRVSGGNKSLTFSVEASQSSVGVDASMVVYTIQCEVQQNESSKNTDEKPLEYIIPNEKLSDWTTGIGVQNGKTYDCTATGTSGNTSSIPSAVASAHTSAVESEQTSGESGPLEALSENQSTTDSDGLSTCNTTDQLLKTICITNNQVEKNVPNFSIEVSDEFPAPNTPTLASLVAGSVSIDKIDSVIWAINKKPQPPSKSLSLTIPAMQLGESTEITAQVTYYGSSGLVKYPLILKATVSPMLFDLIWEGDVVNPPNYSGYYYMGAQTNVRVNAIIKYISNGVLFTEKDFTFRWLRNAVPYAGSGSSNIISNADFSSKKDLQINCFASFKVLNHEASRQITITPSDTLPLMYTIDPLYGKSHLTLQKNSTILGRSVRVAFFPVNTVYSDFIQNKNIYTWRIGAESITDKKDITVTVSKSGYVPISVASNPSSISKFLQRVEHQFNITFN